MNPQLMDDLKVITEEEYEILNGSSNIEKERYMSAHTDIIDCKKLLESGRLIQVRTHTRFIHFPKHRHNYVEMIYMCSGSTRHVISGCDVYLKEGELLILNLDAEQEIYPAGFDDIAVNFIILPEFFDFAIKLMEGEESMLKDFLINCLRSGNADIHYLHFKVADVLPIQNLLENLIWAIKNKMSYKMNISRQTMGLLMLHLMNHTDKIDAGRQDREQEILLAVYRFIEEHYKDAGLRVLAEELHYDVSWLSRMIKRLTGKTFMYLLQTKRLTQAAYLLENTKLSVLSISSAVGYDNFSYFHRIFKEWFGVTPKKYRDKVSVMHEVHIKW